MLFTAIFIILLLILIYTAIDVRIICKITDKGAVFKPFAIVRFLFIKIKIPAKKINPLNNLEKLFSSLYSKTDDKNKSLFSGLPEIAGKIKNFLNTNKSNSSNLWKKLIIYDIKLWMKYGYEDASKTAMAYGLFSTIFISLPALFKNRLSMKIEKLEMIPIFGYSHLEFDFACIIEVQLGNIINVLKMIKMKREC